ncbi:MAG: amino acid adenylation domain-containing protein, partial [Verrucomicrobiales bacterium]|nr:amino acid adenylation domain-containing protein [Verrucomicrobiales bacterium]
MPSASITAPPDFTPFEPTEIEQSIGARFESVVRRFPERPAVAGDGFVWTYEELNRLSNRIARAIANQGLPPGGARIAVFLESGALALAAILGVLKSGHAYVPIDPAFPPDRNRHLLNDAEASLVLTQRANRSIAQAFASGRAPVLDLEDLPDSLADSNPAIPVSPDAPAYLMYTSGSTGRPKGVLQNHRNVLHGCMRRTNLQKVAPSDRMTLFYSTSVMGSVYCIFGSLLNGACLLPYDVRRSGLEGLDAWLDRHRVTIFHSVASVFREFATAPRATRPGSVRMAIFGGERVLASDIELARTLFPGTCEYFTGLGATETGTVRHFILGPETRLQGAVVPIGYPVDGMEILLLDESGAPVPPGDVGEIAVRSRYVALGYWNLQDVNAQVFQPDPEDSQARIYRTGDLGQFSPDGLLEHRGRRDFQVKIRGFRVEIAEVEAALSGHPDISDSVIVAREDSGETRLVAYVVPRPHACLQLRDLRRFVASRVPPHMVPATVVLQQALPRTPNGKIDRRSLPLPGPDNELPGEAAVAPGNPIEEELVSACRHLLRRDEVGINQNFFELGGHSLSATRLIARIQRLFQVRLPLRSVFEAESLRAIADLIASSEPQQHASPMPALQRRPAGTRTPLSFAQRRMWLIDQLFPGSSAYNISNSVRIEGRLDAECLERALGEILSRHEVLRTVFPSDDQGPWQQVHPVETFQLPRTDLLPHPPEQRESLAFDIAERTLREPHDLARGPLFRARLVHIDAETAVLVLVFNHIVYDNIWSSGLFFRELAALYAAYTTRSQPSLPALPLQFGDVAVWQNAEAHRLAVRNDLDYWQRQLASCPGPLDMPLDRPRPARPTFQGGQVSLDLPREVAAALSELAAAESSTLFMVLLAAWKVVLHRYSREDDLIVGTPTGRRHLADTEPMIGLFINTLALRTDCSGNPTFRTLLQRVRTTTIEAFSHDEVPFEDVVAAVSPDRDRSLPPLFQNLFIHRNLEEDHWSLPGLQVTPLKTHPGGAKFDLTLSIVECESGIHGTLEFSRDLYDESTARRLVSSYGTALASIAANPGTPISKLRILPDAEYRHLVEALNQTAVPVAEIADTSEMFELRAARHPEATAILAGHQRVTYGQLNARANGIARELHRLGGGREKLVAVCLDRSPDLIAALLGVLKSGGAYLPLDPGFPPDRLAYMIEDSGASVIITEPDLQGRLPGNRAQTLLLGAHSPPLKGTDDSNPELTATGSDLAYVIYTSGSTGKPKGVQIERQALANFLLSMRREPGIRCGDVLHAVTTVSFDIAALEIFLPLISGASVVMAPREVSLDPDRLQASLRSTGSTVMQATPATWRMLLDSGWTGDPGLRILCGGEAMGTDLARQLLATGSEVWNLYGPTETTIWSSLQRICSPGDALRLGRPIANTQLYVASPHLALQPAGAAGELLIGGIGLARGYHARETLTAEKFVPHPFGGSGRVYRTGDLVRRRPDDSLEFLGRIDNQVKLRGYRIELGEIESRLASMPGVLRAVVILREDTPGDPRLVAYLVPRSDQAPNPDDLRARLKAEVPEYMIPSAFVLLETLPLTPNQKVDRRALPKPEGIDAAPPREVEPPASRTEELLGGIFRELLGVRQVGRSDNFFNLGGTSFLAVRLQARVARETGRRLELRTLLDASTLADLAGAIDHAASACALQGAPDGIPWIHIPGIYGFQQLRPAMAEVIGRHCPYFDSLKFPGVDDDTAPLTDIHQLAEAMVRQLLALGIRGPVILSGYSFGGRVAIETARQWEAAGNSIAMVVLLDTWHRGAMRRRTVVGQVRALSGHLRSLPPGARIPHLARMVRLQLASLHLQWSQRIRRLPPTRREELEAAAHLASERYVPTTYRGRTELLMSTLPQPDDTGRWEMDPLNGWGPYLHKDFHIHKVRSDHHAIFLEPVSPAVLEVIEQLAASTRPGSAPPPGRGMDRPAAHTSSDASHRNGERRLSVTPDGHLSGK